MSRPLPPGRTTRVQAERVVVLAPHYDDEVLGCGGLLLQLAEAGARVHVVFLSDGSGGVEPVRDRREYSRRRRSEATGALEVLGVHSREDLDLPDGELSSHVGPMAEAIRRTLDEHRPDLFLVPSPSEVTADHRAAFDAAWKVLSPLRPGDELEPLARSMQILLYEINHPCHPDVLVDVSGELEGLRQAMARYPSQLRRHGYLRAALGLREFRTLSLDPGVQAAEAYRRLSLDELTAHSRSALIRRLGGAPGEAVETTGATVSVVVRTRDRPRLLAEALESLAESTHREVEVVLVNDGGDSPAVPEDFPFPVRSVELRPGRGRAGAAQAGVEAAAGDHVAFLDDDDLFAPEHLATLVEAASAGAPVVYSDAAVGTYEPEGDDGWRCRERRLVYSRDFDPDMLLIDNYIPFNTLLIERPLIRRAGGFDPDFPFFEDWDLLIRLAALTSFRHVRRVTCEYRHFKGSDHQILGGARRPEDMVQMRARLLDKHRDRLQPGAIARAVHTLREELAAVTDENRRLTAQLRGDETPFQQLLRGAVGRARAWWARRRG